MRQHFLLLGLIACSQTLQARDIYVSPNGNDSASGTFNAPFRTLTKAGNTAIAGDTVKIRGGEYEETLTPKNSGTLGNPIVFEAYRNEKVVITAMQALNNWQRDIGPVYKTRVTWDLGQKNFVMSRDKALDLARWPNNTDGDAYSLNALRNTGGSAPTVSDNAFVRYNPGIPNMPWENGGSIFFYGDKPGSGWLAWKSYITSSNSDRVTFDLHKNPSWIRTAHAPADGGYFYLEGIRGALDYQNEWYFDASADTLYVQLPGGAQPQNGEVKMRRRELTINLNNKHYIEVKNIAVFGGGISVAGSASNNKIYGVSSFYGNHTLGVFQGFQSGNQSVLLGGKNNTLEKSEIAFGSGNGVFDNGQSNRIINSYIHDFNTLGSYDAVLNQRGGKDSIIRNNRISRGGRDAIQAFNDGSEYSYNDVSFSNLIADDCALIYTVGGPRNIKIHHNWFHDAYASGNKTKAAGIYLDNDSEAFEVHHNVVWNTEWTNIQINWDGKDINIFNNTLLNGSAVMGAWHLEGTAFSNVKVWNNLSDDNQWEPQSDKQNNLTYQSDPFVNSSANDFRLKPNTQAIDYGRVIPGITNGYNGQAPDVGAYETGQPRWVAGVDWDILRGPTGQGCYNLPGEVCNTSPDSPRTTLPGTLQVENYDRYFDTTQGNSGNSLRTDDVDIFALNNANGYALGWTDTGEWLEYPITVAEPGSYLVEARVASQPGGGMFTLELDGVPLNGNSNNSNSVFEIGATGGYRQWQVISQTIELSNSGNYTLRIQIQNGRFNLDWLRFLHQQDTPPKVVHLIKRNHANFAIDGNHGGADNQNIYLWSANPNNINQQWIEIDRGNGYISLRKQNTPYCVDGNHGGKNLQNVKLYTCKPNEQNQHWKKVDVGNGFFRLEKRNAPGFSIDGGNFGENGRNVYLWESNDNNTNQHWRF